MKWSYLFLCAGLYVLLGTGMAMASMGGNEAGHGGDEVVRDFIDGWRLALKMVKETDLNDFELENPKDEEAFTFFRDNRDELYKDILYSRHIWPPLADGYKLCGKTDWKRYADIYMYKENCKGTKGDKAAAHFIGESTHHFQHGDEFAGLVAELVAKAYRKSDHPEVHRRDLEPELLRQASLGNFNQVRELLAPPDSVDPNCSNATGATPLIYAALAVDEISVKQLLDHGAYVDTKDNSRRSVFDYLFDPARFKVSAPKLTRIVEELVDKSEVEPDTVDSALDWSARLGDEELFTHFLGLSPSLSGRDRAFADLIGKERYDLAERLLPTHLSTRFLDYGLRFALSKRQEEVARQVLAAGASLSYTASNASGETPLFDALDLPGVLQTILTQYHPPLDLRNHSGKTALGVALSFDSKVVHTNGFHHYPTNTADETETQENESSISVTSGNYYAAWLLVQAGADVAAPVDNSAGAVAPTALVLTVRQSLWPQPALVKLELAHGASPLEKDRHGYTAFDWVCSMRNLYANVCAARSGWNQTCLTKLDQEIGFMQAASPMRGYNPIPESVFGEIVPNTYTHISYSNAEVGAYVPPPSESYDFSFWCEQARDKCNR